MGNQKVVTESQVRKAVRRAFRQLLKEMENEPALVIMEKDDDGILPEEAAGDIMKWLFDKEVRR